MYLSSCLQGPVAALWGAAARAGHGADGGGKPSAGSSVQWQALAARAAEEKRRATARR